MVKIEISDLIPTSEEKHILIGMLVTFVIAVIYNLFVWLYVSKIFKKEKSKDVYLIIMSIIGAIWIALMLILQ